MSIRFGIYSLGRKVPSLFWLVILSNVVHGFAYAFFFATVYIFVDENFPQDVRTSAQSLFNLLILGLGPLVGNISGQSSGDSLTDPTTRKSIIIHACSSYPLGLGLVWLRRSWRSSSIPKAKDPFPKRFPSLSTKRAARLCSSSLRCRLSPRPCGCYKCPWTTTSWRGT